MAYGRLQLLPKYTDFYCYKKHNGTDGSSNSSNPNAVEAEEDGYFSERSRPIGTKQAKAQVRNKEKGKQAEETINLEVILEGGEQNFLQSNAEAAQKYLADKKARVLEMKAQAYKGKLKTSYSKLLNTDTSNMTLTEEQLEKHLFLLAKMLNMIEQ